MSDHQVVKTKKIKRKKDGKEKKALWDKFDAAMGTEKKEIECVYRASGDREVCECCSSSLVTTDEGFQACTNRKCGIVYRDILDRTMNGDIMVQMTIVVVITDAVCQLILY